MTDEALDQDRFLNRELSWLDFNARVLALAGDTSTPLLERTKFIAIFASNMDEFYQVRVAGLKEQVAAGLTRPSADGMSPQEQLQSISLKVRPMMEEHARLFHDDILPALAKESVDIVRWTDLEEPQRREMDALFAKHIFPVLTPLAVDPAHPFPYISNLSLNLAVLVRDPSERKAHFARVKVPPSLPRFIRISGDEGIFVSLEDVIAANLTSLFRGMQVMEHHPFRITRNADVEFDDDGAEDLLEALEEELRQRRFTPAVRLEVECPMPDNVLDLLIREIQIAQEDVIRLPGPLDLSGSMDLYALDRPDLKDEPFQPATQAALLAGDEEVDIFSILRKQDVMVHHPYDSFATSVERFIAEAATDANVLAIKLTLYRTAEESPIVDALIDAAAAGKQVVVIVEIKARFDERANINWARTLERAGCHVAYGHLGLKIHTKMALVVRQEGGHLQRYVHVGTGNYNPKTARIYEDIGLLTSDPQLGHDVNDLFNYLTGYSRHRSYHSMIVAPHGMRERIIELIEREADLASGGAEGRIVMKLNSLVDEAVIDSLYEASQKGVRIDLIVRGICGLRPGVPGTSDTIKVRSILGRFLEHSRILMFANGGKPDIYIGSADLMHRNLDRRVEALVRIRDADIQARLSSILNLALSDNRSAWELHADGTWMRAAAMDEDAVDHQKELMRRAGVRDA